MTIQEIISARQTAEARRNEIIDNAQREKRTLNDGEQYAIEGLASEIRGYDDLLAERENMLHSATVRANEQQPAKRASIVGAIRSVLNGHSMDDATAELTQRGMDEYRRAGISYAGQVVIPSDYQMRGLTVNSNGSALVDNEPIQMVTPIYERSLCGAAGVTMLTGLTGNVPIATYTGTTVAWAGETASAADGSGTTSSIVMSPKRITAVVPISKQLLVQDSVGVESMLYNDIISAISAKLDNTIFGNAKSTGAPTGIFNSVTADTAAASYADILTMIASITGDASDAHKFVLSNDAWVDLCNTKVDAGSGRMVCEGSSINGYNVVKSANVASKGVLFGNMADIVLGQWGGIDITVDPYTVAKNGQIQLVVNAYFDAAVKRTGTIAKKVLYTAAG